MPATPPLRSVPDVENKLRLLYCIAALEQVSEEQLWPFVASLDLMDYLTMRLFLHDLLNSGVLAMGQHALRGMISLSTKGREVLDMFSNRIMYSDRQRITKAAASYRTELKKRRQVQAVYESAQADEYRVLLSLYDSEIPTLLIRMTTADRAYAANSLRAFEKSLSPILLYLYHLAAEPEHTGRPDAPPPEITTYSPREHTLITRMTTGSVRFEITLLLSDVESAMNLQRVLADPQLQKEAAERLFSLLCVKGP